MSEITYTPISDKDLEAVKRETAKRHAREPFAQSAIYDARSGTLTVALRGGSIVCADARALRGLGEATDEQLASVRIYDGRALFWDALDVQYSLLAFLSDALGIQTLQGHVRRAGSTRTPAKAAAARKNGKKGGRPRKVA